MFLTVFREFIYLNNAYYINVQFYRMSYFLSKFAGNVDVRY